MEEAYLKTIRELQNEHGYLDGEAKAAAGFRICRSLAWGKHLYVDDLITDEQNRSRGFAKLLFDWLEEEAKKREQDPFPTKQERRCLGTPRLRA